MWALSAVLLGACDDGTHEPGQVPDVGSASKADDVDATMGDTDAGMPDASTGELDDTNETAAINDYIRGLGTPSLPPPAVQQGLRSEPVSHGDYTCTDTNLLETKQYDKIVAFAANSHTLYPGAIVGASSIETGLFVPQVLPRAPVTISASLEGVLQGPISARLEAPSLSTYREAMSDILASTVVGNTAANVSFDIADVHSKEQLSMAAGIDIDWAAGEFESSFNWDDKDTHSRFVVNFAQTYYTVDLDVPGQPADFFADDVTVEDVRGVIQEAPAYVTAVTFGRLVTFAVESKFSAKETKAALEFGFKGWSVDVDGQYSLTNSEVLNELQINAFILGGDGNAAVETINGVEGLRTFITTGGTYSRESPGAPIAYKLAYLADHTPARFSLTTDYTVTECERVSQNVRVALGRLQVTSSAGDSNGLELYGHIDIIDEQGNHYSLFNRTPDTAVAILQGMQWPEAGQEIASWIVPVTPQPGHSITIEGSLWDRDSGSDDLLGQGTILRRFEDGWRGEWVIPFANEQQMGNLLLSFKPMP